MYEIKQRAKILALVLDLPVFLVQNDRIEPLSTGSVSLDLIPILSTVFASYRKRAIAFEPPFYTHLIHFTDNMGTTTLNVAELRKDSMTVIVFGPMFLNDRDRELFIDRLATMEGSRFSRLEAAAVSNTIAMKDSAFVEAWAKLAPSFFEIPTLVSGKVHDIKYDGNYFSYDGILSLEEGRMRESEIYANRTFENELDRFLRLGDKYRLKQILLKERMALRPSQIRDARNDLIRMDMRFQLSAEGTGLSPVSTDTISEKVRRKIDAIKDVSDVRETTETMIDLYCDAINASLLKNRSMNVLKTQRYITNHIDEKLTLEDLSDFVGLAPEYLCRLFKKETHMTITQYIQQLRINEAIWLLKSTDKSIMDIASSVGFPNQSHFTQIFLKHTGQTPSKFRKKNHWTSI